MPPTEIKVAIRDSLPTEPNESQSDEFDILASTVDEKDALAERWSSLTDLLIDWGHTTEEFQSDELIGPSHIAISRAGKLMTFMRRDGMPLPTGILADGEGGLVLENKQDPIYQRIEINEVGEIKLVTFKNCSLYREQIIDFK